MPVVAFDDIPFERHGTAGTFKAPMGAALTILNEKEFKENYDLILDGLFTKYKSKRKKRISARFMENYRAQEQLFPKP